MTDIIKDPVPLGIDGDASVVVLTGAGISAESGLSTFRDSDGLWEKHRIEDVATPEGFRHDPEMVWRFYSSRRENARTCQPNAGHQALVDLEQRLKANNGNFLLVTQNIDGLHQRAGSENVIPIHGGLMQTRCSNIRCDQSRNPVFDDQIYENELPECDECGHLLRPNVVWFGEMLDVAQQREAIWAVRKCDWFLAVGTSGTVYPVAGYVQEARAVGARTVLANLKAADNLHAFHSFVPGRATDVLPRIVAPAP